MTCCGLLPSETYASEPEWVKCPPGPWGELEYKWFVLAPPADAVETLRLTGDQITWTFPGMASKTVVSLLEDVQLDWSTWPELSPDRWEASDDGVVMRPTVALVAAMTPAQRARIYSVLGKSSDNPNHHRPWGVVPKEYAERWVDLSRMPQDIKGLVKTLLYEHNGAVAFTDVQVVLSRTDNEQRAEFLRWLLSNPAVTVRLRLDSNTNVGAVSEYWESYDSSIHALPLLQSLILDEPHYIDIINLLPSFPRKRLNRYAIGDLANEGGERPDCFWSSVNFLADRAEANPFSDGFGEYFRSNYRPAKDLEFGDIILWLDEAKRVTHACVYVAGNIVFTKNGGEQRRPWILSTMNEVGARYNGTRAVMRRILD